MLLGYINKRPTKMLMVKQLDQNLITTITLIWIFTELQQINLTRMTTQIHQN